MGKNRKRFWHNSSERGPKPDETDRRRSPFLIPAALPTLPDAFSSLFPSPLFFCLAISSCLVGLQSRPHSFSRRHSFDSCLAAPYISEYRFILYPDCTCFFFLSIFFIYSLILSHQSWPLGVWFSISRSLHGIVIYTQPASLYYICTARIPIKVRLFALFTHRSLSI